VTIVYSAHDVRTLCRALDVRLIGLGGLLVLAISLANFGACALLSIFGQCVERSWRACLTLGALTACTSRCCLTRSVTSRASAVSPCEASRGFFDDREFQRRVCVRSSCETTPILRLQALRDDEIEIMGRMLLQRCNRIAAVSIPEPMVSVGVSEHHAMGALFKD
jgi:hypothetical protein